MAARSSSRPTCCSSSKRFAHALSSSTEASRSRMGRWRNWPHRRRARVPDRISSRSFSRSPRVNRRRALSGPRRSRSRRNMDNPFLSLTLTSMRNQLRARRRRLRQPRYAIALILGVGYFTLIFGRPLFFGGRSAGTGVENITGDARAISQAIGTGILFVIVALPWIFPSRQRPALAVSQADVQFLFTAPISRRRLIRYKLLRSLVGALLSSAFLTILTRANGFGQALRTFVGIGLTLALLNLHFTGISLHRVPASTPGTTALVRRWLPSVIALVLVVIVARDLLTRWPEVDAAVAAGGDMMSELARLTMSGISRVVLWPFHAIVALPLADSASAFVKALPWPLFAIALNYLWVVRTDVPFEEASAELAEKIARVRKEG